MPTSTSTQKFKPEVWWKEPALDLELADGQLHLWYFDADKVNFSKDFTNCLSPDELERADSFVFEKDRNHFKFFRAALRTVLAYYMKSIPADIAFEYNQYGRPNLKFQEWQQPIYFNLSHSGNIALCGVSCSSQVGVDVEKIQTELAIKQIAREFFSYSEYKLLNSLPTSEKIKGFFRCWTSKEAYLKSKGTGLSIPLDQFYVNFRDSAKPRLEASYLFPGDVSKLNFYSYNLENKYITTFVTDNNVQDIEFYKLTNLLIN